MMIVFLFPGQGSQYPGMGRDFASTFGAAKERLEEAEELLGRHLKSLLFDGPQEELTKTANSQVAIYTVSLMILQVIRQLFPEIAPTFCAGHSLGEYSALNAAGYLTFSSGLTLVERRSRLMQEACEAHPGGMAALIGLSEIEVQTLIEEIQLPEELFIANFNCPGQIVLSGTHRAIQKACEAAAVKGAKRVIPLQVGGAFHSSLMADAERQLSPVIQRTDFKKGIAKVAMNVSAEIEEDRERIKMLLSKQISHSVQWERSMRRIDREQPNLFIEVGCGRTLAGFNRRMGLLSPTISIENINDLKTLEKQLEEMIR